MSSVSCGFGIGQPPGAEAGQVIVVTDVEMSVKRAGLGILAAAAGAVVFATAAMPAAAGLSDPNPIVPQVPCYPDCQGADVSKANLRNANLTGANLTGADLSKANLKGANLTNADLSGVNFYKANFKDANLTGADITGADFRRAKFKNTICPNGTKTNKGC